MEQIKKWLPVVVLGCAAFVFNTSEFIPIGLLSDIALDFGMTEAGAGRMITIYAWVVAIASLPLMIAASGMEYRRLLMLITSLFVVSHIVSAVASSYLMLMVSRVGVACSHAIFWAIVSPLAMEVAPDGRKSSALGVVITGSSLAMILGMPIGRTIGLWVGWRMTFLTIGVAASLVLLALSLAFPKVGAQDRVSLKTLPGLFRNRALIGVYLMTVVMITAHFTAYSYIEPFLAKIAGFSEGAVTMVLTLFGVVGIVASFLFSKYFDRHPAAFIRVCVVGLALFMLLMHAASSSYATMIAVCVLWGLSISIYNLVFQMEVIKIAPYATAIAMSVYSGIYNMGIGSGALVGGLVCTWGELAHIGYVGGTIAVIAAAYCVFRLIPIIRRRIKYNETVRG